jgi:hypothetical protein
MHLFVQKFLKEGTDRLTMILIKMLIRIHIFDISSTQHVGMHLYNIGLWFLTELRGKQHNISNMYKKEDLIITNYKSVPVHRFITNTSPFFKACIYC